MNPISGERRPIPLAQLMRRAASELDAQAPPPLPEALLQNAPNRPARPAPADLWTRTLQLLGGRPVGIAAGGALVLLGATWLVLGPLWNATDRGRSSMQLAAAEANRFVPVAPAERWVRLAGEGASPAWLMTADLPAERLAAYGLPYDPGRAAEPVRAEFLLNPAGDVLAVRVVNPAR